MKSEVYFSDLRASARRNLLDKIERLMEKGGFDDILKKNRGALVAIKLHFGEKGNTAFIRPVYIRRIVDHIIKLGGNHSLLMQTHFMQEQEVTAYHISELQ